MKTKLFFFTSLLLLSIATATAQTKEKGFFVEMNGGYGEVKTAFVSSTVENPLLFHLGYARYAVLSIHRLPNQPPLGSRIQNTI